MLSHPDQEMIRPLRLPASTLVVARSPHFILALILLLTFLVHAPLLNDWFKADDFYYLRAVQLNAPLEFIVEAFDFRDTSQPVPEHVGHYRPLYMVTMWAQIELFGQHASLYHLLSLLIHVASVAFVWLIAMRVTRRPLVAHVAALVFAFHPTYVTVVGWISERSATLATLGTLICLWSFMKALDGGARSRHWYLVSLTSYLAALLYHPRAAPVLVALVAYYFLVHRGRLEENSSTGFWLKFAPYLYLAVVPLVVLLWQRDEHLLQQANISFGPHVYENYLRYLFLAVVPHPLIAGTGPAGGVAPTLAGGIVAFIAWLGIGGWALRDSRNRAAHVFALLWFLTAILPLVTFSSGTFPRLFYSAGPAFALIISLFLVSALDGLYRLRFPRLVGVAVLLVLLVLASQRMFITQQDLGRPSAESQDFIQELRQTYPALPENSTLYVVGVPLPLALFDGIYLKSVVSIYYGDVNLHRVTEEVARELEQSPRPNDWVFRYSGYD